MPNARPFGHRTSNADGAPFKLALDSTWDRARGKYAVSLTCGHTIYRGRSAGPFCRGAYCEKCALFGEAMPRPAPLWVRALASRAVPTPSTPSSPEVAR